ncbi:unnamed protein product [Adineta ricciae]|uniref:Uncharacterized protein n=2 Tax=Adineta ricciae TaxID=249248 RepID=A0A816EK13_ADIRI|nr:unnamed protein product [Adineta ricciae]
MAERISLLRYLAKSAQEPNQKTMINIFKAIARPVMTYGYPILLTANDKVWDRLQIIQNKALHATLGLLLSTSVEYIHRISKIPKIKEYAPSLLHKSINTASSNAPATHSRHRRPTMTKHQLQCYRTICVVSHDDGRSKTNDY